MGLRGPLPHGQTFRIAADNRPKGKPTPPLIGLPAPPPDLGQYGEVHWTDAGGKLIRAGLLTELDIPTLAQMCRHFQTMKAAQAQADKDGHTLTNNQGNLYAHPMLSVVKSASKQWAELAKALGLTPATRARLPTPAKETKQQSDDPLDNIIEA